MMRRLFPVFLVVLFWIAAAGNFAPAQSPASKNKQGNRLFEEGKYAEAEKAYLEAQAASPDRPELFYNLGNALIKQEKYDLGLQSLRQAETKGEKALQAHSWFNSGNALFELGNFADAAQAYAQALRIDHSDRDAKHNLELALKRLQEQPQGGGRQEPRQQEEKQSPESQQSQSSGASQDKSQPADPKSSQANTQEMAFSREQALQILDALQNQELLEQRKQLQRIARRKVTGRDW